ncbi:MAG: TraR/DksA C4-type zinc finger protein [Candidatus Daviesbacteria bacterium]|nr:TraR/DksA C4-type zinc finger protein [Candidatus Daviesbacteria bacterium]
MSNLPQETIIKIKKVLQKKKASVEKQIAEIDQDDPLMNKDLAPEASESGTDSWMAEVHARLSSLKGDLLNFSARISNALTNMKKGTYGKCEKCGQEIEINRLEALPTATLCLTCSKKKKVS